MTGCKILKGHPGCRVGNRPWGVVVGTTAGRSLQQCRESGGRSVTVALQVICRIGRQPGGQVEVEIRSKLGLLAASWAGL